VTIVMKYTVRAVDSELHVVEETRTERRVTSNVAVEVQVNVIISVIS
jgi:hypothetical protein